MLKPCGQTCCIRISICFCTFYKWSVAITVLTHNNLENIANKNREISICGAVTGIMMKGEPPTRFTQATDGSFLTMVSLIRLGLWDHHAVFVYPCDITMMFMCVPLSDHHAVCVYPSWYHPSLSVPPYQKTILSLYHCVCVYPFSTSKQLTTSRQCGVNVMPVEAIPSHFYFL